MERPRSEWSALVVGLTAVLGGYVDESNSNQSTEPAAQSPEPPSSTDTNTRMTPTRDDSSEYGQVANTADTVGYRETDLPEDHPLSKTIRL